MIKSKTYLITGNYIQAPELAYTTIYVVKKDGAQHDLYSSNPNRSYVYDQSIGRIIFPTSGEKAFVIYKESSGIPGSIPGICEPPNIIELEMPVGIVGIPYEYSAIITGSQPRTLSVITAPAWASVFLYGLSGVKMTGTPTTEMTETLIFNISNDCGTDPFNQSFNVVAGTPNFFIGGRIFTATITSVLGPDYIITSGSLPAIFAVEGIHTAYIGIITVSVSGIVFPLTLNLKKNGISVQTIVVSSNGNYNFTSEVYLSSDSIEIILE